jgi:ABC-type uncharacterized transport system substrate-binding protein
MRILSHIALLWLGFFALQSHAADLLVVVPSQTPLTEEFVSALGKARTGDDIEVRSLTDSDQTEVDPALVITMGVASLQRRLEQGDRTPIIATYVTRSGLAAAGLTTPPDHVRLLLANPKPVRQLRLAQLLIPRLRTAGLLHSPNSAGQLEAWRNAAESTSLKLNNSQLLELEDLARTLVSLLDRSDVLIGIDEPRIYNADNLKTILLTSYTRDRVLIGPSAPFIAAGSLSTTFSSPSEMAQSVSYLMDQASTAGSTSYPRFFSVLSNQQVARSMGFAPPDDAQLASELARMEGIR